MGPNNYLKGEKIDQTLTCNCLLSGGLIIGWGEVLCSVLPRIFRVVVGL